MSVCGWCVGGECRSRGEHSYLGLLPDEEEVCNGDRERVSIHAWPEIQYVHAASYCVKTTSLIGH